MFFYSFFQSLTSSSAHQVRTVLEDFLTSTPRGPSNVENKKDIEEFYDVLSDVPNYPSTHRRQMASPREKVIECLSSDLDAEACAQCLSELFQRTISSSNNSTLKDSLSSKSSVVSTNITTVLHSSQSIKHQQHDESEEQPNFKLFDRFKIKIKASKGFVVRKVEEGIVLAAMNDYDPFTGEFKVS